MTTNPFSARFRKLLGTLAVAASALLSQAHADQIGFAGRPNAEGVVGWNRTAEAAAGTEIRRTGHELYWLRGLFGADVFADYHLAWPGFGGMTAGSTTSLRATGNPAGFPLLARWLAQKPAGAFGRLSIRLDRMDLGGDQPGIDWSYDPTNRIELRRYRRGSLSLLWDAEVVATASNVQMDLRVNYNTPANPQDDTASAVVAGFRFVRPAAGLSADGAAVANALIQDCRNSPLRLTVGQVLRRDAFAGNVRNGFRYELSNVLLETLAPDVYVDVVGSTATEGSPATWTLRLSRASTFPVSVQVQTRNGTANAVADYQVLRQWVQVPPGQTVVNLSTPTLDDALDEADETVLLNLYSPTDVSIRVNDAPATILDNDGPQVRIDDATVVEGGSWPARTQGNTPVLNRVWLSAPSPQDVRVSVATRNGTAMAPLNRGSQDFLPTTNVLVVIPAGQVQAFVTNQVFGDWEDERDEQFAVVLSNPVNATLGGNGEARVTIVDDDGPGMYVSAANAWEGVSGDPSRNPNVVVYANLMSPSIQDVSFTFEFAGGTATEGADFGRPSHGDALPNQPGQPIRYRIVIPAGSTQVDVVVPVFDDPFAEGEETVRVRVSEVRNADLFDVSNAVPGANPDLPRVASWTLTATIFDLDAPAAQARSGRAPAALPIALRAAPGGGLELALPAGKSGSRIEVSTDLRTWAPWTPADPSRPLHVDVDAGSPAAFFRLARD